MDENIELIVKKIVEGFSPDQIILYGSRSNGDYSQDSDIDLLIVKSTKDTRGLAREIDRQLFPRNVAIDLTVVTPEYIKEKTLSGDLFVSEINRSGRKIYERG